MLHLGVLPSIPTRLAIGIARLDLFHWNTIRQALTIPPLGLNPYMSTQQNAILRLGVPLFGPTVLGPTILRLGIFLW